MRGQGIRRTAAAVGAIAVASLALGSAGAHDARHKPSKPGGSAKALVPLPPPNKYFGYNDLSFLNKRRYISPWRVAELAAATGANVHRYEIAWDDVEPVRDRWNETAWAKYQAIDQALWRQGIRSMVTLGRTPDWARQRGFPAACKAEHGCEYPPSIDDLDHWREFAAEAARRLQNPIIETWNEPNLALFFKPFPNPGRYARMHVAAYQAIKRARPRTPVLLAGNANTQSTDTEGGHVVRFSQRDFLRRIYPEVKGKFDGISLHPYLEPPPRFGRRSMISHAIDDARAIQARFKDRGNDLWITETGVSTTGPRKQGAGRQAKALLASYRQLSTMADVKAVLIHTLFDQTDFPPDSRGYGFGVIRNDAPLRVKPAFCAFNGRARRGLVAGCTRKGDRGVPGAKRSRKLRRVCGGWLRPQRHFRRSRPAQRDHKAGGCLVDLLTIEAAKRGRVKKLRRRAALRAANAPGAHEAARGRQGIIIARQAVKRLARSGYR